MVWVRFALSALAVVAGGIAVAQFGDVIALRTGLGRFLFGTILLAAGTSLPDLFAALGAVNLGVPDLAAGDLFGGCLTNMLFLALLDLISRQRVLLHLVAIAHSLTAALAILLLAVATFFILVPLGLRIGSVDLEGILLLALFVGGVRLIQAQARRLQAAAPAVEPATPRLPLWKGIVGFAVGTLVLLIATPVLVAAVEEIALITGVGAGFAGVALLPLVTTAPELVSSITAVRLGAFDLAVGNLLGSCVINMAILGLVSLFFGEGPIFAAVSPGFGAVGLLGLILISTALLGTLARPEPTVLRVEWDALLIVAVYLAGLYLLYQQGLLLTARR